MAWLGELSAALEVRDLTEQCIREIIERYSELADRTASQIQAEGPSEQNVSELRPARAKFQSSATEGHAQHLADAQKHRSKLQVQVTQLEADLRQARFQSSLDTKRINDLVTERRNIAVKLKDREEEIRGKGKLLEDVHDETVALTLQLNVLEESSKALRKENEDLVDRWMTRMGEEAEAMNIASRFQ